LDAYPLLLAPIYKEKVWGGRQLARLGRSLPGDADTPIGESWELADLGWTAPSGGGGGPARSVVENGPLAGHSLRDLLADDAAAILGPGRGRDTADGEPPPFPLLVKILDARRNLSVQVHPSAAYAASHPEAHLKSEAWYVVDADPDAVLYKGVREGTTEPEVRSAVRDGTIRDLLIAVPAVPGHCHYLPSGTCHALGGGIVVAEVQTPSDTTFRLFDWGREGRELHVEPAIECMELGPLDASAFEPDETTVGDEGIVRSLVRCKHFRMDEWVTRPGTDVVVETSGPEVWMVLGGGVRLSDEADAYEPIAVERCRTVLLPSALDPVRVQAADASRLLRITLPAVSSGG